MVRQLFTFCFCFLFLATYGQTESNSAKKTSTTIKYAGTYSYGSDIEKGRVGTIIVYPETDSTVLFYLDLNRGTPSYNMGSDYGRIKIINDSGTYYMKEDENDKGCKWSILFLENALVINTIDNQDNCGFGYGVYTDGTFTQTSKKLTEYFENQEGEKIYFRDIK